MASAGASGHSSVTPAANRLLQKKWDDRKFRVHKDRLRSIKASVDNGAPRNFVHIKQNLRKQRIDSDRMALIQRHNNELLRRMQHTMTTTGRVDHQNLDWKPKKSLGYVKRAQEMERISRENQAILQRIHTVKPQYSTRQWESDFTVHRTRSKTLSLFPEIQSPTKAMTSPPKHASGVVVLPPIIEQRSSRPETQPSEIQEEIEVED